MGDYVRKKERPCRSNETITSFVRLEGCGYEVDAEKEGLQGKARNLRGTNREIKTFYPIRGHVEFLK